MKYALTLVASLFISLSALAQNPDAILGVWLNEPGDAKVEIYKQNGKYFGKIIWLKNDKEEDGSSPNRDNNNPDESLRNRRVIGINILKNLVWDADDQEYDDGEIYDPRSGSTYSLYGYIQNDGKLFLKGYIGFSLIGRSTIWTRSSK
ncbi:MAG: DUF2147 domain-containing protein [Bacteroidetes bacterium]|uniref:DUF2147 domain-containing protein n=1 Tax=Phaeocystidibacter marisrubri TaxID=1577780 RepID=A0A6L3ZH17_9FLAO|nr:DUF2147 domain-containing protein [Phaeocystidibacter marisrubri]KAB2817154.1 DUF2147 domain-containing protein [Phaeocystidibacter marisrubri]TNE28760.1 MAG: DUF2147 domain-containing protein [Bacteroidota bacterium]GGH76638.1 hypothetical protein GCM10011318_25200 [Phaeocystidibacter marisrubri]